LLFAVTALVLRYGRSRRYLPMGWFWFLGTLVPVIGLVQVGVQGMADRYVYIPYIGLFICLIWGAAEIARERKVAIAWLAVPAVLVLVVLGVVTNRQIRYWHDSETLWRHTLSVTGENFFAHNALGYAFREAGRVDEAVAEYNASAEEHAYTPFALNSIGEYEQAHGHVKEAITQYLRALDAADDAKSRASALGHLSSAFMQEGDFLRAKKSAGYALHENPDEATALVTSGLLAARDGDFAQAATQISNGMKIQPTDVGYLLLAQMLRRNGQPAQAGEAQATAQRISSDIAEAQQLATQVLSTAEIKAE
jgi:protein O-mannosyl-transferase